MLINWLNWLKAGWVINWIEQSIGLVAYDDDDYGDDDDDYDYVDVFTQMRDMGDYGY